MTKILLIDNDSDTLQELYEACKDAGFAVDTRHCTDVTPASADGYEAVVLSGGWWYDDEIQHLETYKGEMELLRTTRVPVVGICLGMQLMQIAYSGQVQLLDMPQHDSQTITVEPLGQQVLGWPPTMIVHKNHTMGAISVADGFEVLARSPGHIEIIRHTSRPLLGVQFHPEVGDPRNCALMMRQLVDSIRASAGDGSASADPRLAVAQ